MTSTSLGSGLEPGMEAALLTDFPSGAVPIKGGSPLLRGRDLASVVRPPEKIGTRAAAPILLRVRKGSTRRVALSDAAANYGVRLADLDGQVGAEIPLLSDTVAGALREVSFHSIDRGGFELWRGQRLILKAFPATETPFQEPSRLEADRDLPPDVGWR